MSKPVFIVISLPGGIMEGLRRLWGLFGGRSGGDRDKAAAAQAQPAE